MKSVNFLSKWGMRTLKSHSKNNIVMKRSQLSPRNGEGDRDLINDCP